MNFSIHLQLVATLFSFLQVFEPQRSHPWVNWALTFRTKFCRKRRQIRVLSEVFQALKVPPWKCSDVMYEKYRCLYASCFGQEGTSGFLQNVKKY